MQIESLKYFVELARAGSFYAAAKNLFISQQGLSKAIRALEQELDTQLVVRSRRGVQLTKDGEALLAHANSMIGEYNALLDDLVIKPRRVEPNRKRFVVNVSYYGAQVLASLASELDLLKTCTIVEKPFRQLIAEAERSDGTELYLSDLYVDTFEHVRKSPGLDFVALAITQFGIVYQDGSPFENKEALHRADLVGFPLAVDSHREMLRYAEFVYDDYPLDNIQLGVANPRATLAYALTSPNVASTFDSFGFAVARRSSALDLSQLHFTPLATPRARGWLGFVFSTRVKPGAPERHFVDSLASALRETFPEYYAQYPL